MSASFRPSAVPPTTSADLVADVAGVTPATTDTSPDTGTATVTGVTLDSRAVRPGDVYAALPGANVHGARFAGQAVGAGATVVFTDPAGARIVAGAPEAAGAVVLVADDPRAVLGALAARVYGTGTPAGRPRLLGITGTNGKTTTAYLAEAALRGAGYTTGLIGTIETRVAGQGVPSARTTPEAPDLHGLFALMAERGVDVCVMEVSSHALSLHRVDGAVFDVAVFTNLSQDHLDFHGTMEDYFAAKASLFTPERARRGVVCVDDAWGRRLAAQAGVPVVTLTSRPDVEADWRMEPGDAAGLAPVVLTGPDGAVLTVRQALPGEHNRLDAALAALALDALGVPDVPAAMDADVSVPGRMQLVNAPDAREASGDAPRVYVDFAHTPEAVTATLSALAPLGRPLVALLGAGGDRDAGKRPLMGAAAARVADVVVVTDDNPRHEDPAAIRAAVAAGVRESGTRCIEVAGRAAGIARAVAEARAGEPGGRPGVVALLGKGHERTQAVGDEVTPFDDVQVAARALAETTQEAR